VVNPWVGCGTLRIEAVGICPALRIADELRATIQSQVTGDSGSGRSGSGQRDSGKCSVGGERRSARKSVCRDRRSSALFQIVA
jgi:hypothetical protein